MPIRGDIQCAAAEELHRALRCEISSLPHEMHLLNIHRLMGEREANRILIMHFEMIDIERASGKSAVDNPQVRMTERAVNIQRTIRYGITCRFAAKVMSPKRIKTQLIDLKRKIRGIAVAQLYISSQQPGAVLQVRISRYLKLAALSDGLKVEPAGVFVV